MSRPVHQDYIVRQRYSNALPPPPGAPKLLEIKTGGLKQYTAPTYASRLARIQPLNVEADADLGMPIDLVGMPGVFEGDESAILAPLTRPTPHAGDRNLLRPLKEIGQAKKDGGLAFLRRTQYTADGGRGGGLAQAGSLGITPKRRRLDTSKEDPKAILRNAIKGFDLANPADAYTGPDTADNTRGAQPTAAEADAWKNPKHPTNPSLKPIDFYPILPDFESMPYDGGYMVTRFHGNPGDVEGDPIHIPEGNRADPRIEASVLHVETTSREAIEEYASRKEMFEKNPESSKDPGGEPLRFQFFLPENLEIAFKAKRAFDTDASPFPEQVDALYTTQDDGTPHFRIRHARYYETRQNSAHPTPWGSVAMVLWDGEEGKGSNGDDLGLDEDEDEGRRRRLSKGAYFAPINSTHFIRPERKIVDKFGRESMDDQKIDILHFRADETSTELQEQRKEQIASFEAEVES